MGDTPTTPKVQVFSPTGDLVDLPYDQLHSALADGAKIAAKMKAPDGTVTFIPGDRVPEAMKDGGVRVPLDGNDADGGQPGFWSQAWGKFKSQIPSSIPEAARMIGGQVYDPRQTQAGQAALEYNRSRDAGAGVGRSILNAAGSAVGVDPARQEAMAASGNTAGVAADAAVPAAEALLGLGVHEAAPHVAAALPAAADAVGTALRTPEGKLIAPVKVGAKLAGMAGGHFTGVPGAGELGGYLMGDKLADMLIPDRPDAMTAAQRKIVAKAQAAPINGPAYPTAEQLAQGPVRLADLAGGQGGGVSVIPEPRAPLPGDRPGSAWSLNRTQGLPEAALRGQPGAGDVMRQLQPILYAPSGEGISNVRSRVNLSDLTNPGDFAKPTSNIKLSAGEDLGPGLGTEHTIHTPDGKRIGSVTVEPRGDGVLHVNWLGGDLAGNATRSDIMNALKQEYPGTTKLTYDRRRLAAGADAATTEPREMNVGSGG